MGFTKEERIQIEERAEKELPSLTIQNDFIFGFVFSFKKALLPFLQRILPKENIQDIEAIDVQHFIRPHISARAIVLDVRAKRKDGTIFALEMQVRNTKEIPQRSRLYGASIDLEYVEKGSSFSYKDLPPQYIIFVMREDLFQKNRGLYAFSYYEDKDRKISLEDGSHKIFLYTDGIETSIELSNILAYIGKGIKAKGDPYLEELDALVQLAKTQKEAYMNWLLEDLERRNGETVAYNKGRNNTIFECVLAGGLSKEFAKKQLGLTTEDFNQQLEAYKQCKRQKECVFKTQAHPV